ncbi:class I adenylate-forming enzyme family protein [Xanthobacter versatilis]|uniref:class I adenylate-forming enzyme family protein n=1 Tax=Xanthobacter autotrophicus (strain ATCC BAA-1158 / Py2) TaxID=78245 RepID=UPI0037281167
MLRYEHDHLSSDVIAHNARLYCDKTAVVCGDRALTWGELNKRTNRVANALRDLGYDKGDKIAVFMPNSLESFELFWGVVKSGCVVVSLNTMLEGQALARLANASDAQAIFVDESTRALIDRQRGNLLNIPRHRFFTTGSVAEGWRSSEEFITAASDTAPDVKIEPDDSMTIIFTSGTTGVPKGIEHSHFGRLNYPLGFGMGLSISRYSVAICATPIYASGTWITMFPTMYRGGKVVLLEKYSPEAFLEAVEREGGTHSFLVPTQYIGLLQHDLTKYDLSTLQGLITAGQTLPEIIYNKLLNVFNHAKIYEVYGMTEGFATLAIPGDIERGKRGTVGKASFLEDIRVIDSEGTELPHGQIGEIVAYGPGMMKGYYGRPDLTREATWIAPSGRTYLRSGDLGWMDEEGFLFVTGRLKDMIKSGGINIYASDLEGVLMQHEAVKEVAIVGIPHEKWSETPVAAVILKQGRTIDAETLRNWANERLSKYQRLSHLLIREDFPRATYGKVQKTELCNEVIAQLARERVET